MAVRIKDRVESKFYFAYALYIDRPRYYTYEIKVHLPEYSFVLKEI